MRAEVEFPVDLLYLNLEDFDTIQDCTVSKEDQVRLFRRFISDFTHFSRWEHGHVPLSPATLNPATLVTVLQFSTDYMIFRGPIVSLVYVEHL